MSSVIVQSIDGQIRGALEFAELPPQKRTEQPQPRWTLKRLVVWVKETFGLSCCRETVRKVLKRLGLSWKKAHKLLDKANTEKRAEFLKKLEFLIDNALNQGRMLI